MDQIMTDEIKEIIQKNLPQQVGETLQKRLELIPKLEKQILEYQNKIAVFGKDLERLRNANAEYIKNESLVTIILGREKQLHEDEIKLQVKILTHELQCEKDSNAKVIGFVDALMRNTTFRENKFINYQSQLQPNGNYADVPYGEDTTKSKD